MPERIKKSSFRLTYAIVWISMPCVPFTYRRVPVKRIAVTVLLFVLTA
ncbi:MAG: hypothetical protein LBT46_10770 [Planctomycetaceae bacterium]|nr:hypothetical protein [Planctomycetaceae bacterium]